MAFLSDLPAIVYVSLLTAAVLMLVARSRGFMRDATRVTRCRVWCPVRDRKVAIELVDTMWDGRRIDVNECSEFAPPSAITCEKACLRHATRPRPVRVPGIPPLI